MKSTKVAFGSRRKNPIPSNRQREVVYLREGVRVGGPEIYRVAGRVEMDIKTSDRM